MDDENVYVIDDGTIDDIPDTNDLNFDEESEYDSETSEDGKRKRKEVVESARKKIFQYYKGSYYGLPASHIIYTLSQQLNADTNELLWYSIVGITFQYLCEHISQEDYSGLIQYYSGEVLNKNNESSEPIITEDGSIIKPAEVGKIQFIHEFNFPFYRHWTLFDAMLNSTYISGRLGLIEKRGIYKLNINIKNDIKIV